MNHGITGFKNLGQCVFKLPTCSRREFVLGSWQTLLLPTYWAPSPTAFSKNLSSDYKISGSITFAQIGSKLAIFHKIYFLGKLTTTTVYLLCSSLRRHFRKILRKQIISQGCIILAEIWPEISLLPKGDLLEKFINTALVFYIPSCYINSKKSRENRL